jgi:hypothetical protein
MAAFTWSKTTCASYGGTVAAKSDPTLPIAPLLLYLPRATEVRNGLSGVTTLGVPPCPPVVRLYSVPIHSFLFLRY